MSTSRLLALSCAATLALATSAASAQSAGVSVAVEAGNKSAQRDVSDRFCLRQTGTRINRARVTTADANPDTTTKANRRRDCGMGPGRAYTREDIDITGRVDLADALRALDPSIR